MIENRDEQEDDFTISESRVGVERGDRDHFSRVNDEPLCRAAVPQPFAALKSAIRGGEHVFPDLALWPRYRYRREMRCSESLYYKFLPIPTGMLSLIYHFAVNFLAFSRTFPGSASDSPPPACAPLSPMPATPQ